MKRAPTSFTAEELAEERKEWAAEDARLGRSWPSPMVEVDQIRRFVLAGNATFTIVSLGTGTRFTYRVRSTSRGPKSAMAGVTVAERAVHHVAVLTGPSNEQDYQFLGTVFPNKKYVAGRKSKIAPDAPSARAFTWFWIRLASGRGPSRVAEFWHEGRCGRCGRCLTVPESIASGLGPECARKK